MIAQAAAVLAFWVGPRVRCGRALARPVVLRRMLVQDW